MKRDEDGTIVAFERGEVVWGIDPFKQDRGTGDDPSARSDEGVAPRPWLIISTESVPFHPEQYLCLTLTTRTWHEESIALSADNWVDGGAPADASLLPWSVAGIQHRFLDTTGELRARLEGSPDDEALNDGYQGRLSAEITDEATRCLIGYLRESLES